MLKKTLIAVGLAVATLAATATPASATEYSSALKIQGVQYNAPGPDDNRCAGGNTSQEYLTIKNYSKTATINLRGYLVKDAVGNSFKFTADHYLQPGDYVRLRGGNGNDSDANNVVYRDNCNFIWNNTGDSIYLYKPSGAGADSHSYKPARDDADGNGYVTFH